MSPGKKEIISMSVDPIIFACTGHTYTMQLFRLIKDVSVRSCLVLLCISLRN